MKDNVISLDQWRDLSDLVGGDLFRDPYKLEAMRSVQRQSGPDVTWDRFCYLVHTEIRGELAVAPTGKGKGLPSGSIPFQTPK